MRTATARVTVVPESLEPLITFAHLSSNSLSFLALAYILCRKFFVNVPEYLEQARSKEPTVLARRIVDYVVEHGDDLSFAKFFRKECEPNDYELRRYSQYAAVLADYGAGVKPGKISAKRGSYADLSKLGLRLSRSQSSPTS